MNQQSPPSELILASSSKYRKMLLQRLAVPFSCRSPKKGEAAGVNESPANLVRRLAREKAHSVAQEQPQAVVIGSDQVAVLGGQIIGKPGSHQAAVEQLTSFSGRSVEFLTAVSVQCIQDGFAEHHIDFTQVCFRTLEREEIERYLVQEKPYDCAGAFRAESLGIALFERIISQDPTALIGLPLIRTVAMLRRAGLPLP